MSPPPNETHPAEDRAPDEPGSITLVMLGDPVPYARSAGGKTRVRYTPQKQRTAAGRLAAMAEKQMARRDLLEGPLLLELVAEFPIPRSWSKKRQASAIWVTRRPDFDNLAALVANGLNGIVYRDDAQISKAVIEKRYGNKPRVLVRISQITTHSNALPTSITASENSHGSRSEAP